MLSLLVLIAADVVAAQPIARGDVIAESHLSGPQREVSALVGKQARRPIFPGRQVRISDVQEPVAVERQSAVTVLFVRGSLMLRTEGRALKAGAIGDAVSVVLPGRRQPIAARVTGLGEVQVLL